MKKIILILLSVNCVNLGFAQMNHIEIQNEEGEPIEKAQILDKNAKTIRLSDAEGHIHLDFVLNESYMIKRLGYVDKSFIYSLETKIIVLSHQQNKGVTITGKKNETRKTTGSEVIDKCELGKLACCNLAESFENSNTVDVNYSDGITGGREIQMLGLSGTYSQQLLEGTPYHRGILNKVGLELVPGPWIESIGINKGIGSVVNGFDNISGQINIEFMKPKKSLDWFVNGYISEIAKTDINIIKGFQLSEKVYTNFLAHTSFSNTTMDNNGDGFSDMPVFRNYNFMNKWQYFAENGFVLNATVQGTRYENEAGQILSHESGNHPANPYIIRQNFNSYQALVKTGWELDAVKESSIAVLYRLNFANQSGNIDTRAINNEQIYANITPIYQSNLNNESVKYKFGFSSVYNKENESIDTLKFHKNEWINGIFSEWTIKHKTTTAILGIRADYHNTLGFFLSPRASFIFSPTENHILKISGGAGFKTPTYLTESFGYLISNRKVILPTKLQAEKAFNAGISYKYNYKFLGLNSWVEGSYFLTLFQNQMIINVETPQLLKIEYMANNSRAQSFQLENQFVFSKNWSLKLSYKNDQNIALLSGNQKNIPLLKNDKFLANLYWTSNKEKFRISTTLLINGSARLPQSSLQAETYSPTYPIVHAQLNYVPNPKMDFYVGSENIFAYNQSMRIFQYDNTQSPNFDAGMIWGPMDVRRMYVGGKLSF